MSLTKCRLFSVTTGKRLLLVRMIPELDDIYYRLSVIFAQAITSISPCLYNPHDIGTYFSAFNYSCHPCIAGLGPFENEETWGAGSD